MLLNDADIRQLCLGSNPLIDPFQEAKLSGVISCGLTHAGYDLSLAPEVKVYKPSYGLVVDPKRMKDPEYAAKLFDDYVAEDGCIVLPPAPSYILVRTTERFNVPNWLKGHCLGKSTYARCGVIVNTTPLEPGWRGYLTVEIANSNPNAVKLYVGEGIAQVEFLRLTAPPQEGYGEKKYQDQIGVVPARV